MKEKDETTHLRLNQDEINEQDHKVVLDIFVREPLATRTLRQTHTLAQRAVVGLAVGRVQVRELVAALYTDWHCSIPGRNREGRQSQV